MPPRLPPQLLAGRVRAARYVSPSCAASSISSSVSASSIWPGRLFSLGARQPLPPTTAAASATRSTATAHSAATTAAAASGRRTTAAPTLPTTATYTPRRTLSDSAPKTPAETEEQSESLGARPNEDVLPHVSEEAAAIGRIISGGRGAAKGDEYEGEGGREGGGGDGGELGPDLGQGTPVQEILQRDPDAQEKAPQVIKEELDPEEEEQQQQEHGEQQKPEAANITSYSSSDEGSGELGRADEDSRFTEIDSADTASNFAGSSDADTSPDLAAVGSDATASDYAGIDSDEDDEADEADADVDAAGSQPVPYYDRVPAHQQPGNKFELPPLPLPPHSHLKNRYDEVVGQVTRLMMQHGKLGTAQRNMALVLSYLRAAPPPVVDPQRPLLPGAPPPQQLPLDPIRYLTLAIDSVAPLFRIHSLRGAAGGGQPLLTPVPLRERQRRRTAVMWILGAASKRPSRGGGKDEFARRVAEEIIAVVEGRSAAWEKRMALHKLSVSIRGNVADPRRGGRR